MTEIAEEVFPASPILVLAGPSFARETVAGTPTAVAIAGDDAALCEKITAVIFSQSAASSPAIATAVGVPATVSRAKDGPASTRMGDAGKTSSAISVMSAPVLFSIPFEQSTIGVLDGT